ncbi:uncharacterized protein TNCV_2483191 [Trichonephila clavipes]|uniref:Integrase catalytic domain-containing protein n=1 Tax=Trichonephila clavipes TaxID=2585209 RepID=A0A8X6VZ79_TRICX|nr:uncharacterized protein TNCV_2483191 [Trichonephila clavipes]
MSYISYEIDTGDQGSVVLRPYRYDRVKQGIIDYHIEKMLQEGTIRPNQSPYASTVVLTRKNNGLPPDSPEAYRFEIDYRKLNAITKNPRYPLIGVAPNFQKAIDIILKPVIGRFVMVYMDDVIITSTSFNEHIDHLVLTLLRRNPVGNIDGSQISCAALRALALNSREQLIREQREDPELGHICRYLENPDDGSVNATVITDHFTKWNELIPLRKASAQAIANVLFENYVSRYGAPISLISDNGPQFISEVFEHLHHRLDIKHIKTVTYRPQANLTERVNRNLVQMIACFVEENHDNRDRFLHEFAFALHTSVNETTVLRVGLDQGQVYHPRQVTISFDSHGETLYEGQRSSNGSSRSHPGKSKESRNTSSEESKGGKSNKGKAGWEDPRLKRKGSEHGYQKRQTPAPPQGIKRTVPSSISSRNHKYTRPNNLSQGPQSITGPSHQLDTRQFKPPIEESRQGARVQYDRARETRTTPSKEKSAAERRSRQATAFTCRNCGGGDRGRVPIYRPFGEVSLSLNRTVTCMVLKANDRRTSCPCHDEFRGPRSDYVRQVALATTTTTIQNGS